MANVQKKSMDELLRLDAGITDLFSSGLTNGLFPTTDEKKSNLFAVLMFQEQVQEEIRKRILKIIPLYELETAPQDKE